MISGNNFDLEWDKTTYYYLTVKVKEGLNDFKWKHLGASKVSGALGKVFSLEIIQPPFTFPVKK